MLAILSVQLPFALTLIEGQTFNIYDWDMNGYRVRVMPPQRSPNSDKHSDIKELTVDGKKTINADIAVIEFQRDTMNRTKGGKMEPSHEFMGQVLNDFLMRLRYVTNSHLVNLVPFPTGHWKLDYLNDDRTQLPEEDGLTRGRGGLHFELPFILLSADIWEAVHAQEPFQPLPGWRNLLLEAQDVLPNVGPSIVLTLTALEVFITSLQDELVERGKTDKRLWAWLTDRKKSSARVPRIDERFDFLNDLLLGKSLQEDQRLWQQFHRLRKARNEFAHRGIAAIDGHPVTEQQAREFIQIAVDIVAFIKQLLPADLLWPEFNFQYKLSLATEIKLASPNEPSSETINNEEANDGKGA